MADITMCNGNGCPLKLKCLRFISREGMYQPYYLYVPYDKEKKECIRFLKVKKNK